MGFKHKRQEKEKKEEGWSARSSQNPAGKFCEAKERNWDLGSLPSFGKIASSLNILKILRSGSVGGSSAAGANVCSAADKRKREGLLLLLFYWYVFCY
jgi:hypothetical protein